VRARGGAAAAAGGAAKRAVSRVSVIRQKTTGTPQRRGVSEFSFEKE